MVRVHSGLPFFNSANFLAVISCLYSSFRRPPLRSVLKKSILLTCDANNPLSDARRVTADVSIAGRR
jgi:hypothetical protein